MFELVLFIAILVTGIIALLWRYLASEERRAGEEPWYVDYAKSFFPVLLIVFMLRSFLVEPFRIPSGSMLPTLQVGDFILVNKFSYGIRLPVVHNILASMNIPERGDVMVFRWPGDNKTNYIKRVIGLPGDVIEYQNKRLTVNGKPLETTVLESAYEFQTSYGRAIAALELTERLGDDTHHILINPQAAPRPARREVPEGHYFVMGDNRDHSADSRAWGFVPELNVVGRAFFIWFSWDVARGGGVAFERIGDSI
jgi:signal peptidase I